MSLAAVQREGQDDSDQQQKQRIDHVLEVKTFPAHMFQLVLDEKGGFVGPDAGQSGKNVPAANNPEHVESAQGVNREDAAGRRLGD